MESHTSLILGSVSEILDEQHSRSLVLNLSVCMRIASDPLAVSEQPPELCLLCGYRSRKRLCNRPFLCIHDRIGR